MSPRKLIGVRDPFGIKPLVLGKKDEAYMFSSESAAIKALGGTVIRDVKPGEIVTVSDVGGKEAQVCSAMIPGEKKEAHCIFEYIYFARSDSVIDNVSVYEARVNAGRALARASRTQADIVVGVPDSGLAAAEGYAKESNIPLACAFHKNSYVGRSFIKPTDEQRRMAVHMKLSVHEDVVKGKRVILIDDSIVRGTTMRQIVEMLREEGAAEVHVRVSSPPFLFPCYYGTDVPSSGQLIASRHSTQEICKSIGADTLEYLRLEDLSAMVGDLPLCAACFNDQYPV
jgi:amidophosphoribosyltransferase